MRIVQTFWTGGHNPLEYGFGWPHAEYNLMSWALSCLSLREHYDEVVLYTDSAGKRILIDELHLPYTDVQVVFDDFPCLPQHWALAKIKTYSLQTKPFLHVDGDIYVPRPLPEEVLAAPLIAQNREIGTIYYRRMMDRILSHSEIKLPDYIEQGLREESIASYNMGFFGGSDLSFIHDFCKEVFRFMEENRMNDPECPHSHVDCNVFFEQVIFAMMVDREHDNVACVLGRDMRDNGYTRREFCDLQHYDAHPFHHLLGGHKRNSKVLLSLEQLMLRREPELAWKITHMINVHSGSDISMSKTESTGSHSVFHISEYDAFAAECTRKWSSISDEELFEHARHAAHYQTFLEAEDEKRDVLKLQSNPYVQLFDMSLCEEQELQRIKSRHANCKYTLRTLAVIPALRRGQSREMPVQKTEQDIISLASFPKTYADILSSLFEMRNVRSKKEKEGTRRHITHVVERMIRNGLLEVNIQ